MNKTKFIEELSNNTGYDIETAKKINDIFESNFFISKKSKPKIIFELINNLDIEEQEADRIYNIAIKIVNTELKDKLIHPFKSRD